MGLEPPDSIEQLEEEDECCRAVRCAFGSDGQEDGNHDK